MNPMIIDPRSEMAQAEAYLQAQDAQRQARSMQAQAEREMEKAGKLIADGKALYSRGTMELLRAYDIEDGPGLLKDKVAEGRVIRRAGRAMRKQGEDMQRMGKQDEKDARRRYEDARVEIAKASMAMRENGHGQKPPKRDPGLGGLLDFEDEG